MVYFITARCPCGAQLLKVGKAGDVDSRFNFLRRENALELTLLGRISGDEEVEKEIHDELDLVCEHQHNEWWEYTSAAREIVERYIAADQNIFGQGAPSMVPSDTPQGTPPN